MPRNFNTEKTKDKKLQDTEKKTRIQNLKTRNYNTEKTD